MAAKLGNPSAQLNLGYTYDVGIGVRRNRAAAIYWYRRAYRQGVGIAASNIGTIFRGRGQLPRGGSLVPACAPRRGRRRKP
ncbi:MAG: hypothetical protein ACREFP_08380 [Acetobacteraceae bacterium]